MCYKDRCTGCGRPLGQDAAALLGWAPPTCYACLAPALTALGIECLTPPLSAHKPDAPSLFLKELERRRVSRIPA